MFEPNTIIFAIIKKPTNLNSCTICNTNMSSRFWYERCTFDGKQRFEFSKHIIITYFPLFIMYLMTNE